MDIVAEIKKERLNRNWSQAEMAQQLGLSQQVYSNIEAGKTKKIAAEILTWLQKNTTSFIVDNTPSYTEQRRELKNKPITNPVKFYDVDFSAGNGVDFIDDIQAIQPAYTMDVPEFNGCTAFRSFGKSMEPLIDAGAILFATKDESWQDYIEYGQIYGIVCNNKRRFLKYIQKSEKPGYILLRSENIEYEPFDLPLKVVKSIWLVNGWINKRV